MTNPAEPKTSAGHGGHGHPGAPASASQEALDMREHGAPKNGEPQVTSRRLFVQLQVFTGCSNPENCAKVLEKSGLDSVIYLDINDSKGIAVLFLTEDPAVLAKEVRCVLNHESFSSLTFRPEFTMLGRTYSMGREADLEDWLLRKPRRNALNPKHQWAVWYPLRRKPEFELLTREEQGKILFEHAKIGMTYGQADFAHDIRLACHGLDAHDNEFVLGLLGQELHPLSRVVQDMRKTQQTARFMQSLGPFFIGKVFWQSPLK